ncbi:site-specific integrase [Marinomonas sp. TI.3.20]|uniref:tyrosine-type recombinase/integrase n=1 Tax=Marinomonas sp. TI.3.20 TaxID=3121296 RepID=UPI00311F158D
MKNRRAPTKLSPPAPVIINPRLLVASHTMNSDYSKWLPTNSPLSKDVMHADLVACIRHIIQFSNSLDTMSFYRTELNRFLCWSWLVKGMSITEMRRDSIVEYIEFCIFPPATWTSPHADYAFLKKEDGTLEQNPKWRPFLQSDSTATTQGTITTIFSRLSAFYATLMSDSVIDHNPVQAIRQKNTYKKRGDGTKAPKVLTEEQVKYCLRVCEALSDEAEVIDSNKAFIHAERALFAFSIGLGMYLRVSELVWSDNYSPTHGDFFKDADGRWWFRTIGKGNQERVIVVSDDVLAALVRYRRILDLPDLPTPADKTPLIMSLGNGTWDNEKDWFAKIVPITDTAIMWKLFKKIFSLARAAMINEGRIDDAYELLCASCHWLRHTGISNDVQVRPIEHVRDDSGHKTSQTTWSYVHSTNRERAMSKKGKGSL